MKTTELEVFLARLYTDQALCRAFLEEPAALARAAGLNEATVRALESIDREGLIFAADSFARKRASYAGKHPKRGLSDRLRKWFGIRLC